MNRKIFIFVIVLTMFLLASSGQTEAEDTYIYMAGVDDNFAAPLDVASPSAVLSTVIRYRWEIQNFDLTAGLNGGFSNRWIAHTFSDLPPRIVSATLEFRIKGGDDLYASDDDFWLLFYDEITSEFDLSKKAYRVAIGNRGGTTQGLSGMEWGPGSVATLKLDLSALPLPDGSTISVMEDLKNYGFIDVMVTDDTAVDFYRLTVLTVDATELVSINATGTDSANGVSIRPSISADGRYVAFESTGTDLGPNDTNGYTDIYIRDLQTGTTRLVSVNATGNDGGNNYSGPTAVSGDGRYVTFASMADDLVPNDTNGRWDVYVRDLQNGTTTLVSVNSDGTNSGNRDSYSSSISADGRYVAFESDAFDLGPTDTNNTSDVYVRDLQTGTTTLVSVNADGTDSGNLVSYLPVISADGRFVAFQGNANDLGPDDTNGASDVYVRDLQTGTTSLVSVNSTGNDSGNDKSLQPSISADGRYVAFNSKASDLGPNDTNNTVDVYVRDLQEGITTIVSVNSAGTDGGNGMSFKPAISGDGRYLAFRSYADDLGPTDTNGVYDIYVRDLQMGTTTLVSVNDTGNDSGNGDSAQPIISSNGNYIAFMSLAPDLEAIDTDSAADIFLYTLVVDSDGDGIPDYDDACSDEDATGFDIDEDGCIDSIGGLGSMIASLVEIGVIDEQMENSLLSKIDNAEASANKENICTAINQLEALINQVNAQRGKKISDEGADDIIAYTNSLISWYLDQLPDGESC